MENIENVINLIVKIFKMQFKKSSAVPNKDKAAKILPNSRKTTGAKMVNYS